MTNTREKLIEFLEECVGENVLTDDPYDGFEVKYGNIADHLIANGVTVNAQKYEAIDLFIESKVLDGKDYPAAKLFYKDYQKELERLYNGVTVQKWIPVTERLPEIEDSYLVVVKAKYDWEDEYDINVDVATYNPYEKAYIDDCWNTYIDWDEGQQYLHVTHWMPLPEPPKEGDNNA